MILQQNDLIRHTRIVRYDVLFPQGVFPMYDYEMRLLDPDPVQERASYVKIAPIEGD